MTSRRVILHVDMDAFFASVEERDRPELAGRPVIVGGRAEARGVVAAASYAARRFGVHSAMPMRTALRLCPEAVVLPPRLPRYREVSARIRAVFSRYTPLVEPLSLDEAYLDITESLGLFGGAEAIGRRIKADIRAETGLTASVGIGPNKLAAKIASDLDKPDGFVVAPDDLTAFLDALPVSRLPGVGRAAQAKLDRLGIRRVRELRLAPASRLEAAFGARAATRLAALARGEDNRPVTPDREAKSISHERTFAEDVEDAGILRASLLAAVEEVGFRLRRLGRTASGVELKLRYDDFRTITRHRKLAAPTDATDALWGAARQLLDASWSGRPVRLIGMGVDRLGERVSQPELFAAPSPRPRVDAAADAVRERFGAGVLRRAAALQKRDQR